MFWVNVVVSALVISFASWLSERLPNTAGFIIALPLSTMLVLPMSHVQHRDPATIFALAKGIFLAVPVVLVFLLPFLLSGRMGLAFWPSYGLACCLLVAGFFAHRFVSEIL